MSDDGLIFDDAAVAQRQARPAGDTRTAPTLLDTIGAGFRTAVDEADNVQVHRRAAAYDSIVDTLVRDGYGKRGDFRPDFHFYWGFGEAPELYDGDKIFAAVAQARRQHGPTYLRELGDDRAGFEQGVLRRGEGRGRDQETLARASGVTRTAGAIVGGLAPSLLSPTNAAFTLMSAGTGGAATTVARGVLREGVINMAGAVLTTPEQIEASKALGEQIGVADVVTNIAAAGALGGTVHLGGRVLPGLAKGIDAAATRAAAPIRQHVDAVFADRDYARAFARMVPEELRTPEQQAAIHVIERHAEVIGASPFTATYAGDSAHLKRLDAATEALTDPAGARVARPPRAATGPSSLDRRIVGFFKSKGYSDAQARGIAAGIHAESASNPNARNPTSGALGIGQWLGPRKRAIVGKYGANPTLEQQLEFIHGELRGGDPGGAAVLAGGDEVGVLNAYIRKFMRPAAGAETDGDLARGLAALGRRGESAPGDLAGESGAADAAQAELADALGAERMDVDLQRMRSAADDDEPQLDPAKVSEGLIVAARQLAADRSVSLSRVSDLAGELGVGEADLRGALEHLVGRGELRQLKDGTFRRPARAGAEGPDDLVRFVARRGGLSYDGFSEAQRARNLTAENPPKGHDLRNSGNLDHFVPGAGKLLRPSGRGLDDMAELAWEAGYFGPPETTPRPTEAEFMATLDQVIGRKETRFGSAGSAERKATAADFRPDPGEDEHALAHGELERRAHWDRAAELAGTPPLFAHEIEAIHALMDEGTDVLPARTREPLPAPEELTPYVVEMVNREIDAALEAAYLEIEDPAYGFAEEFIDQRKYQFTAGSVGARSSGRSADPGDARAGEAGADARGVADESHAPLTGAQRDAAEAAGALGPVLDNPAASKAFDDPDGDGVRAAADSLWHDIRQADPAIAERQREEAALRAEAPLRGENKTGQAQDGEMGLGLFDAADQPRFDLEDGKGPRPIAEIDEELTARQAGIDAIRDCLK